MSILDDLNALPPTEIKERPRFEYQAPGTRPRPGNPLGDVWGRKAPGHSDDLDRILAVPRRPKPSDEMLEAMVALMGQRLMRDRSDDRPTDQCACKATYRRRCILQLNPIQAWALYEAGIVGGLLGAIVVGCGKTALGFLTPMVVPNVRTAVLLVPPKLVEQLKNEYRLWAEHWKLPSLICPNGWAMIQKGRPVVHVVPLSQLSRPNAAVLLDTLQPDLIIADEAHKLKYPDTARTGRLLRYFEKHPATKLCAWSGSLTDKSLRDYAHMSALALGPNSPLPFKRAARDEWAAAIDPPPPGQVAAPPGALAVLCEPGESLRDGYRRRLLDTRGVVATHHAGIGASLPVYERDPRPVPKVVLDAIQNVRATWEAPNGDELVDAFSVSRCARELASGFYYYWIFPRGEPTELIAEWFAARKEWSHELREKLKRPRAYLDSPMLCAKAAIRYYDGYEGELPVWESQTWPRWREVRGKVKPQSEAEWLDDYLVRDAAAWAKEYRGIVWYEHTAFGRRLSEVSGLPLHAGGPDAEERIKAETGDRSIIASTLSHGEGRDGLQFLFSEQLVANPPVSRKTGGAGRWEQLIGRLHRQGQESDEVSTHVYRHTAEMREAWDRALELAQYVTGTMGSFQKLLACAPTWDVLK